ncbi:hypothetical protein VNO77_20727 [Canavalia gladiata]|uniref:Uncharacterized protein n=1 Tax=Canavalia gladiata TaxID=3824 RepID=A0AAN9LPS3_CANGL
MKSLTLFVPLFFLLLLLFGLTLHFKRVRHIERPYKDPVRFTVPGPIYHTTRFSDIAYSDFVFLFFFVLLSLFLSCFSLFSRIVSLSLLNTPNNPRRRLRPESDESSPAPNTFWCFCPNRISVPFSHIFVFSFSPLTLNLFGILGF